MSTVERNDPITQGVPGRTSCASAIPASTSAVCCTSAAGGVTGAIAPISRNGVTITACPASAYVTRPSSMRESKRSGEFTFTFAKITGSRSICSRPPKTISAMRRQSCAAVSEEGSPAQTRSVSRIDASVRTRWRESSGTSFGSRMLRPGVSSASVSCVSRSRSSRSASVPSRRSPSIRTNGGPCAGPNTMWSPPTTTSRARFRARSENTLGARAACAFRKSGSNRTVSPSTVCPAAPKSSSARGWSNWTPISRATRSQPRSIVASASSESGS